MAREETMAETALRIAMVRELKPLLEWAKAHEHAASDMHDEYNRGYGTACREVVVQLEKLAK